MKSRKTKQILKMGQKGIAHYVVPLIIIIGVAIVGTAFVVASHADSVNDNPVASAASGICGRNKKLVNMTQRDYRKYSKNGKSLSSMNGHNGVMCVRNSDGRPAVPSAGNNMTIVWMNKCASGHVFAYDSQNPNGDEFKAASWRFKTRLDGGDKTMYCVKKNILGKCVNTNGNTEGVRNLLGCKIIDSARLDDRHAYQFVKPYQSCDSRAMAYTECKANQFFIYAFMKNTTQIH